MLELQKVLGIKSLPRTPDDVAPLYKSTNKWIDAKGVEVYPNETSGNWALWDYIDESKTKMSMWSTNVQLVRDLELMARDEIAFEV